MAVDNEVHGSTEGPFEQFIPCIYGESSKCKYKDTNGYCIFEHCLIENRTLPPAMMIWYFECIICKTVDAIKPNEMKAHVCATCIQRMQAVEVLPFNCRWCGRTVNEPPPWMFSGICPVCDSRLKRAAWEHDFNDLR